MRSDLGPRMHFLSDLLSRNSSFFRRQTFVSLPTATLARVLPHVLEQAATTKHVRLRYLSVQKTCCFRHGSDQKGAGDFKPGGHTYKVYRKG